MSIPSNDRQQALLNAVWRWHLQRQRPETPEEFVVAGLATCSPRLLSTVGFHNVKDAWSTLDEVASEIVMRWWKSPPGGARRAQRKKGRIEQTGSEKLGDIIDHPHLLRRRHGLSQGDFWPRFGIEQSGGSRYEGGRALPDPLRILLTLLEREQITFAQLEVWGQLIDGHPSGSGEEADLKVLTALRDPRGTRSLRIENQTRFWSRFGMQQAAGTRYENGAEINRPVKLLMAGFFLEQLSDEVLRSTIELVADYRIPTMSARD